MDTNEQQHDEGVFSLALTQAQRGYIAARFPDLDEELWERGNWTNNGALPGWNFLLPADLHNAVCIVLSHEGAP